MKGLLDRYIAFGRNFFGPTPGMGFRVANHTSLPTCSEELRGVEYRVEGAAGVTDVSYVCMKDSANAYAWTTVVLPGGVYTDEQARDAVGAALVAGNNIDITVNDGANTITIDVETLTSADLSDFTEAAQDAVGGALTDSGTIDFTYTDGSNTITASVIQSGLTLSSIGGSVTDAQVPNNITISDFTNATHGHTTAATGGALTAAAIGSGTIATARLGSGTANSSSYLRGDQTWDTIGIDELNDVAIAAVAQGQLLTYDAGSWVNADPQQGIMTLDDRTHAYVSQFGTTGTGNTNFDTPRQIARDVSGNLYVADNLNTRIKKHDSSGTFVATTFTLSVGHAPYGIAVDSSGNVYSAMSNSSSVYKHTSAGGAAAWTNTLAAGVNTPNVTTDGTHVFVTANLGGVVEKFLCSTGVRVATLGSSGSGDGQFNNPVGITNDGTYLYVVDQGNDRIQKFTLSGAYVSKWGRSGSDPGEFQTPVGIHYNSVTGFIYVTDSGRDDVQEFTTDGAFIGSFGAAGVGNGQFQDASGVVNDVAGSSVWVADATQDRLQKFTRSVTSEEATRVSFNPNDFIVASTDGGETGYISFIHATDTEDHAHAASGDGGVLGPAALGVIGIYQDSDYTGSNVNTAQKVFDESTNGAATVAASTAYLMQAVYHIHTTGTTSRTTSLLFGGTATYTSLGYGVHITAHATEIITGTTFATGWVSVATATQIIGALAAAAHITVIASGIIRVNAGGTLIPQYIFSAAPGVAPVTLANSYFQLTPIGASTTTTIGAWS